MDGEGGVSVSKVVHLSNEAHAQAKVYCKSRGLKMSDWVGALIIEAISENEEAKQPEPQVEPTAPRKKKLPKTDDTIQSTEQGVPVYSHPPFWAKQTVDTEAEGELAEAGEAGEVAEAPAPAPVPESLSITE